MAPDATGADIRAAQRRLALELHPDRHSSSTPAARSAAAARMAEVNASAAVLLDPDRRRAHDAQRRPASSAGATSAPTAGTAPTAGGDTIGRGPVSVVGSMAGVLPWLALVGVLFGIFVFTAFAGGPGGDDERRSDPAPVTEAVRDLRGECVQLAAGFTLVVNCATAPNEGRIVVQGSIGAECPEPTVGYVIEQQDALVCVEPGTGSAP